MTIDSFGSLAPPMTSLGLSNEPLYKEFWKWEGCFPTENKNGRFLLFFLFFWYFSPFFKYQSKTTITSSEMVFKDKFHNKKPRQPIFGEKISYFESSQPNFFRDSTQLLLAQQTFFRDSTQLSQFFSGPNLAQLS